jgi:hypothetical protein
VRDDGNEAVRYINSPDSRRMCVTSANPTEMLLEERATRDVTFGRSVDEQVLNDLSIRSNRVVTSAEAQRR